MTVAQRVHASFKAKMDKKSIQLPINVQKVEMASSNIARLLVSIPDVFQKSINDNDIGLAIEKVMPGARYLPNSISRSENANLYSMFVANTPKVMTKEAASSMVLREVGSQTNVFRDDDDNIWNFHEDANGGYFTAQAPEDLENLILGVRARNANIVTASLEVALSESFSKGTPLVAYDVASEKHAFGIAVSDTEVYFPGAETVQPVQPTFVVAAYEQAAGMKGVPVINFSRVDKKKVLLDYMRALYGQNASYYKRIEALVREHLKV